MKIKEHNNTIIDISRWQANVNFQLVKNGGILAVIHKATEGATYTDPRYHERVDLAKNEGLLWGAYHFATAADPKEQVKNFLKATCKDGNYPLLAIDIESNTPTNTVNLEKAEIIVKEVYENTNRYPLVYGSAFLRELLSGVENSILYSCPLWLAHWTSAEEPRLIDGWSKWTIWQYTDGQKGGDPKGVEGVEGDCDRDRFNGSVDELIEFWNSYRNI